MILPYQNAQQYLRYKHPIHVWLRFLLSLLTWFWLFLFILLPSLSFCGPMEASLIVICKKNKVKFKKSYRKFKTRRTLQHYWYPPIMPPSAWSMQLPGCLFGNQDCSETNAFFCLEKLLGNQFVWAQRLWVSETPLYYKINMCFLLRRLSNT